LIYSDCIYDDRRPIIIACVNHGSMFIQMSNRMNDCTMRYALISLITDKIYKEKRKLSLRLLLLFNEYKKTYYRYDLVIFSSFLKIKK